MNSMKQQVLGSPLEFLWHFNILTLCVCVCVQKCLRFDPDATVWSVKQQVVCSLSESLWDVYNYGLFQPASEGHHARFLEEEQTLRQIPQSLEKGVPYLEVLYLNLFPEMP